MTKFLFDICDCMVDSDVCMGDFLCVLGILHLCEHVPVRLHFSLSMDCKPVHMQFDADAQWRF